MAELYRADWLPSVRIKWLHRGTERQIDIPLTETFSSREKAEEHGLAIAKSWVDDQIARGNIVG